METTEELKLKILNYIENADEKILRLINSIIERDIDKEELTQEQKNILDKRMEFHQENPNDGKSWNEVKSALKIKYGL